MPCCTSSKPKKYIIPHFLDLKPGDKLQYWSSKYYMVLDNPSNSCEQCSLFSQEQNQCNLPFKDHYQCSKKIRFQSISAHEYGKSAARNYTPTA